MPLERIQLLNLALKHLSGPEKVVFNLMKLVIVVPPFFLLAQLQPWLAFILLFVVLLGFSFISRPIQIYFARPHWQKAIREFEDQRKQ